MTTKDVQELAGAVLRIGALLLVLGAVARGSWLLLNFGWQLAGWLP